METFGIAAIMLIDRGILATHQPTERWRRVRFLATSPPVAMVTAEPSGISTGNDMAAACYADIQKGRGVAAASFAAAPSPVHRHRTRCFLAAEKRFKPRSTAETAFA